MQLTITEDTVMEMRRWLRMDVPAFKLDAEVDNLSDGQVIEHTGRLYPGGVKQFDLDH